MFYDFNRHKKLPPPAQLQPPENPPPATRFQKLVARIPEKAKMPLLILLLSFTGLGFFNLLIDGILLSHLPELKPDGDQKSYYLNAPPLETYLDSLERAHMLDSLYQTDKKQP